MENTVYAYMLEAFKPYILILIAIGVVALIILAFIASDTAKILNAIKALRDDAVYDDSKNWVEK